MSEEYRTSILNHINTKNATNYAAKTNAPNTQNWLNLVVILISPVSVTLARDKYWTICCCRFARPGHIHFSPLILFVNALHSGNCRYLQREAEPIYKIKLWQWLKSNNKLPLRRSECADEDIRPLVVTVFWWFKIYIYLLVLTHLRERGRGWTLWTLHTENECTDCNENCMVD